MSDNSDSESSISNDSSYKPCFFCETISNYYSRLIIQEIGKVDVCSDCDDILRGCIVACHAGPRFFLAKPFKTTSQLPRYVFDDVEEFKQWCEHNEQEEDVYTFGMTRTAEFPEKEEWLKTGNESDQFGNKRVYWYKDRENVEDPLNWKWIYYTYIEADSDLIHWCDGETSIELDLPKFFKQLKSAYRKKQKRMCKDRVAAVRKVQKDLGF